MCNLLYRLIEGHADWTFGWPDFWAFLITQILAMLGGFALAALLLNTPAAIVAVLRLQVGAAAGCSPWAPR